MLTLKSSYEYITLTSLQHNTYNSDGRTIIHLHHVYLSLVSSHTCKLTLTSHCHRTYISMSSQYHLAHFASRSVFSSCSNSQHNHLSHIFLTTNLILFHSSWHTIYNHLALWHTIYYHLGLWHTTIYSVVHYRRNFIYSIMLYLKYKRKCKNSYCNSAKCTKV